MNAALPLIVAAFGIAGTLGGVWLTQRRADHREDLNWTRELERERERWAREDAARTFEDRRTAYIDFYEAMMDAGEGIELFMAASIRNIRGEGDSEFALPPLWVDRADERLHILKIYASPAVSDLADKARTAYRDLVVTIREIEGGNRVGESRLEEDVDEWNETADELRTAIRKDLGVPSG